MRLNFEKYDSEYVEDIEKEKENYRIPSVKR